MFAVGRLAAISENGISVESYEYDDSGKIIRINYLNASGGLTTDKYGIAAQNLIYNADGHNYRLDRSLATGAIYSKTDYSGINAAEKQKLPCTISRVTKESHFNSENELTRFWAAEFN